MEAAADAATAAAAAAAICTSSSLSCEVGRECVERLLLLLLTVPVRWRAPLSSPSSPPSTSSSSWLRDRDLNRAFAGGVGVAVEPATLMPITLPPPSTSSSTFSPIFS